MKKLLVGSVFADDSPTQQKWLDLQLKFLSETTDDFDHIVVLSDGKTNDYFEQKTKVLIPEDTSPKCNEAHNFGLNRLLEYFKQNQNDFENFLFIDADAFPIKKNWMASLLRKMQPQERIDFNTGAILPNKMKGKDYEIAVALRSENLETRLHASILFVKKKFLDKISFSIGLVGNDLAGNQEQDIYVPNYQYELRHMALPLIRTNKFNLHPLACGIYFDMFYHHACGSGRPFNLRAADNYLASFIPGIIDVSGYTEKLMADPCEFVQQLAGWNPTRYAKF